MLKQQNNFYLNYGKRIFDFICVLFGLLCLWKFLIFIAILIKLTSKGPVFFKQVRIGLHFQKFHCLDRFLFRCL